MSLSKNTIFLVSCVSQKGAEACEARDLYVSNLFRKARHFVEKSGHTWFILSAEYGLVKPDQVISPYERTLNAMRADDRRRWADGVRAQLSDAVPELQGVVFLAGQRYREFLAQHLEARGIAVSVPMKGLRIGEQLRWLGRNHAPPLQGSELLTLHKVSTSVAPQS